MIKRLLILASILAVSISLFMAPHVYALDDCLCGDPIESMIISNCQKDGVRMFCDASGEGGGIKFIISFVLETFFIGVVVVATIGIIWSGILVMTARDNSSQLEKAKKRIFDIVIGLFAFVMLWLLIALVVPGANEAMLDFDRSALNQPSEPSKTPKKSDSTVSGGDKKQDDSGGSKKDRPRSCGPAQPGTPGANPVKLKDGGYTQVYTTYTGRTYYIYRQDDPRWGSKKIDSSSTWAQTGCASTSFITVAHSYSNGPTYKPPRAGRRLVSDAKKYNVNLKGAGKACSGTQRQKIKCVIQKGGVVVVHSCDGRNCPNRGNHWFPIVDYKEKKGVPYYFLANTINGGGRFKIGWVTASSIERLTKTSMYYYIPRDPIDCSL